MEKIKYIIVAILVISAGSCKKFDAANVSPNSPTHAPLSVILTGAEVAIAYSQGGDIARYAAVIDQQVTGASRQFASYQRYSFTEADFDNVWPNLYSGAMSNLNVMISQADQNNNTTYAGIARILMAYTLGMTTDMWGDVPYSNAFKGISNLQPKFDNQQQVYTTIHVLLDSAIAKLSLTDLSKAQPGGDDVIYGGSSAQWKQLAYALNARFYLHTSKVNGAVSYATALGFLTGNGLTGNSDDAQFTFASSPTNNGPWFQYNDQRGDISYSGFLDDLLTANSDPRAVIYSDPATGFPNDMITGPTAPVIFFSYAEQQFIIAECQLQIGNASGAQTAYQAGITASMSKWGIDAGTITTFLAGAQGTLTGTTANQLSMIMTQKYIADYLQPEAWTDWRRTSLPVLAPTSGTQIPRRFLYPSVERLANNNCPQSSTMFTPKVWWDL